MKKKISRLYLGCWICNEWCIKYLSSLVSMVLYCMYVHLMRWTPDCGQDWICSVACLEAYLKSFDGFLESADVQLCR